MTPPHFAPIRWRLAFWWLVVVAALFAAGGAALGVRLMLLTGPSSFALFGPSSQGIFYGPVPTAHPDLGTGVLVLIIGLLAGSAFGIMAAACRRMLTEIPRTSAPPDDQL